MGNFSFSVYINSPQEKVFDFLTDPSNLSKWNSTFEAAKWTSDDAPEVGSKYQVSAKLLGRHKEGFFEIIHWDRPVRYGYQMVTTFFPIKSLETIITMERKDQGTLTTFSSSFAIARALQFAEGFFTRMGEKQDKINLEKAKKILELNNH